MNRRDFLKRGALAGAAFASTPYLSGGHGHAPGGPLRDRIDHIVIVFQENRSFDHYFGAYRHPGGIRVDNLLDHRGHIADAFVDLQKMPNGTPYAHLPMPDHIPGFREAKLPNRPFRLAPYLPASDNVRWDPEHRFFRMAAEIHNGRMDRFVALALNHKSRLSRIHLEKLSEAQLITALARPSGPVLGFYDRVDIPFYHRLADEYVLYDRFFQAATGGSTLNALYLAAARSCTNRSAPTDARAPFDPPMTGTHHLFFDRPYNHHGVLINDLPPVQGPTGTDRHALSLSPPPSAQTYDNIGDRLTAAGRSWVWYNENWNQVKDLALKTAFGPGDGSAVINSGKIYVAHHNPFQYYARWPDYVSGGHMRDAEDFLEDARRGQLPAVSFIKAAAAHDEHPADSAPRKGMHWVEALLTAVGKSPSWARTAVFITYDEGGGFWDHIPPPGIDAFGCGTRVPAIMVSAYARKGYVDHRTANTASILRFIETRFGLPALTLRDAGAYDLLDGFDCSAPPRDPVALIS